MSHSYSCLFFHIVWGTKYRIPFFSSETKRKLYQFIGVLSKREKVRLMAIGGTYDHIHILVQMDVTQSLPTVVRNIKSKSSKFINVESQGYSVFSVSPSMLDTIKNYIAKQEEHHQVSKFEDEINFLLQL
jgi:REP element-mobilizing transposase RayT